MEKLSKNVDDDSSKKVVTKLALGIAGSILVYWGLNRLFGGKPQQRVEKEEEKTQASQKSNQKSETKTSNSGQPTPTPTAPPVSRPSDEEILKLAIQSILQQIKIPQSTEDLDVDSLDVIYFEIANVAARRFEEETQQNRNQRRRVMKTNPAAYQKLILDYNTFVEQILEDSQNELVQGLGIKQQDFKEMIINLSQTENFQKVIMMQSDLRQKIQAKIKPQKQVNLNEMKDVLNYQVQVFQDKPKYLSNILDKLKNDKNLNAATLHLVIQDEIYNKFKLEEEDNISIMASQEFVNDMDINQYLAEIQCFNDELIGPDGNQYDPNEYDEFF